MQQLISAFGLDWHLLIIQMVNFGVLLAALTYFLYTPVMKMIDDRREKIAEGMRAYDASSQRLLDAKIESEEIVGGAARDAETMLGAARARAEVREKEIVRAAESKAEATVREGIARAAEERRKALSDGEREIARVAMLASEKLLRENRI